MFGQEIHEGTMNTGRIEAFQSLLEHCLYHCMSRKYLQYYLCVSSLLSVLCKVMTLENLRELISKGMLDKHLLTYSFRGKFNWIPLYYELK